MNAAQEDIAYREACRIYMRAGFDIGAIPLIIVKPVRCGRFLHDTNRITLPSWLFERTEPLYIEWYIAHELTHGLAGKAAGHGPYFQMVLADLAPDAWHWESTYKLKQYKSEYERRFKD